MLLPAIRGAGPAGSAGAAFAILVMIVGMSVNAPAARRLSAINATVQTGGGPPSAAQAAEMGRLQNRLFIAGEIATVLVLLAVACMGVARYVP